MMTAKQVAADIVSAFAVHNFNLGQTSYVAPMDELRASIEAAILAEREECAKIADSGIDECTCYELRLDCPHEQIAKNIRARST